MGLESATYISGLNASNPINATDVVGEGDDHLRLIKSTLLNTFPNITGAMNLSHTQLNNAAIKNAANIFTAQQTFQMSDVVLSLGESDAGADSKNWIIRANNSSFRIQTASDGAPTVGVQHALIISRSGTAVSNIQLTAPTVNLNSGTVLRIFDASQADSVDLSHDGTDLILKQQAGATTSLRIQNMQLQVENGQQIRALDSSGSDFVGLWHDGTSANFSFGGTSLLTVRGGVPLRLNDPTNTDYFQLSHDGTYANISTAGTTAIRFNSGDDIWMREGAALRIYSTGDTGRGELSHNTTDFIISTSLGDVNISPNGGDVNLLLGTGLRLYDTSQADQMRIVHNGTDVDITFVNTTAVKFRDGVALRLYDSGDTKFIGLKHDGTDAVWVSSGVTEFDWTSLSVKSDNDTADEVGWKGTPQNSKADSYTLLLSDAGKQIYLSAGASKTLTIPANASVAFPIGTIITVVNDSGNDWSIAITTDTLEKYGGSTGTQTLSDNAKAVLEKVTSTLWKYASTD